ncbi:MAG TPA: MFS transporter [Candidatus Limnocylindrales bacterium]|nr:MFS transporter [Candidatus Limnocylindrales bacterium]
MTVRQRWTMVAAILGSATVFLDGTIVNVALPKIGEELPATLVSVLEGQTYATSGYLATLAALLILAGALADYYGRRRIFSIGLAGFAVSSVLCGLAPDLELFVLFRIVQGAAGALLVPCSLSIITATFDGPARSRAFGIWASATSATTLAGPIIGGLLVDAISWRVAFLINVPILAVALWATRAHMAETRDDQATGRFDWLGAVVVALAVGGLAFGGIRGQEQRWSDPIAFIAIGVGVVALVAFPFLMARRRDPLVPLGLFRSRDFAVINLSTLLIYGALYMTQTFQALFFQGVLGYRPWAAGALGLPIAISLTLFSTKVGTLAGRFGARPFLTVGPALMAAGQLWLARIPSTSAPWTDGPIPPPSTFIDVLPAILLFAAGITCIVAPLTSTLMGSVPVRNSGLASAINNAVSRVGQPLMSALIFIVITATFYGSLAQKLPGADVGSQAFRHDVAPLNPPASGVVAAVAAAARDASTEAFRLAMIATAILLFAGGVVNWFGLRDRPARAASRRASDSSEQVAPPA